MVSAANMSAESIFYFDSIGIIPYWLSYKILNKNTLGGSTVKLYDKLVIPASLALSRMTKNRIYGKNLIVIAKKESQN